MILDKFNFSLSTDNEQNIISNGVKGETVAVPHSWKVTECAHSYNGTAWYSTEFHIDKIKNTLFVADGIFLTCDIYVNGIMAGSHSSGYTQFNIDISNLIKLGSNLLVIKVNNSFNANTLPYGSNYDWNNDGGLLRTINILSLEDDEVYSSKIQYDITKWHENNTLCDCDIDINIYSFSSRQNITLEVLEKNSNKLIYTQPITIIDNMFKFSLNEIKAWTYSAPTLYVLRIIGSNYVYTENFGIRQLFTKDKSVYLNNKKIKLLAIEYMPGSNPDYGMAEPIEELISNLQLLKDANCNFTRFHWQQDKRVYDWCDEHGLMVQEEIPYWGSPRHATKLQIKIAKEHADDMLFSHINHPSIVCWGIGNELDGFAPSTCYYAKELIKYFKERDKTRLVNYVSNTLGNLCGRIIQKITKRVDATTLGDICMWNEYSGTWNCTTKFNKIMELALSRCKEKPLVITEFGLCEPHFKGGDARRIEIYEFKLKLYRQYGFAGWVYFSLNDYRTHLGESGAGRFKQRIHGSTDLYRNLKPSYNYIKEQNAIDEKKYNS